MAAHRPELVGRIDRVVTLGAGTEPGQAGGALEKGVGGGDAPADGQSLDPGDDRMANPEGAAVEPVGGTRGPRTASRPSGRRHERPDDPGRLHGGVSDTGGQAIAGTTVLRRLVRISAPPWGRLALAALLGVAAAMATVGLLAGSGYVVDRAAFRPGLGAIAGLLAAVEVLAFLRGPLRYGERLVAHDAAFRALTGWRVWLYDRLEPLAPAGLRAWRSGDLLSRAIEDVDTLQDLYLRGLLPVVVTVAAATLAVVVVGVLLPVAGLVLAATLLVAVVATPLIAVATRPARGREAALRGELAAEVVDLVQGAPELVAFGREPELLDRVDAAEQELARLARRRALTAGATSAMVTLCVGAAVVGVLAVGIRAVHAHHLSAVMLAVLPLAAIGAFETVPAVAMAALRTGDVVAAGRRLLALEAVPVPVTDPSRPRRSPAGVHK